MFRFLSILALAALAYSESDVPDNVERTVGGSLINIHDVPWQLSLLRNNAHFCGATLISATWVISAAHCTFRRPINSFSLLAGTANRFFGGQARAIAQIIHHPNYNYETADNDISLIRAASAFSLDSNVRAASLPNQGAGINVGTYGLVTGWGATRQGSNNNPNLLLHVRLPVVDQSRCNTAYSGRITGNMFCAGYWAGGKDTCQGDSGGPFAVGNQLVGVVSFGRGCAQPNFPGVYARVSNYRNWIRSTCGV